MTEQKKYPSQYEKVKAITDQLEAGLRSSEHTFISEEPKATSGKDSVLASLHEKTDRTKSSARKAQSKSKKKAPAKNSHSKKKETAR